MSDHTWNRGDKSLRECWFLPYCFPSFPLNTVVLLGSSLCVGMRRNGEGMKSSEKERKGEERRDRPVEWLSWVLLKGGSTLLLIKDALRVVFFFFFKQCCC